MFLYDTCIIGGFCTYQGHMESTQMLKLEHRALGTLGFGRAVLISQVRKR